MTRLSVYIIAFNEEAKIADAVDSVRWADEVIVADSGSTDRTAEIAGAQGARVVQIPFQGFGALRNSALDACQGEWIFSLDADERCTPEAADEIRKIIADPGSADVWLVPRQNYFLGRWVRHSDWYPDFRQPQLFRRGALRYTLEPVHEGYVATGRVDRMRHAIVQWPFRDLSQVIGKMDRYSTLGTGKLAARGVRASMGKALLHGVAAFLKSYVVKRGVLDGWAGFIIALGNFEGTFYRYAKLAVAQKGWDQPPRRR